MKKHGWIPKTLCYIKEVKQKWWDTILIPLHKILQKKKYTVPESNQWLQETSFLMRLTVKSQDETF